MASPRTSSVLWGVALGAALGLFLGERVAPIQTIANAYIKLLQMAVLPYVTVSIIASIGALRREDLRSLGMRSAAILAGLWALALACALIMPLAFPPARGGAFFSTTLLQPPEPFDIVDLYIPANPFFALANNVVPAVVLFSMFVGVALIGVPRRQVLLDVLQTASETLSSTMRLVMRLVPYGLFAIAAATAGTMRLEQAVRLQIYVLAYGAMSLFVGLWVLPGLVSVCTPIRRRQIFDHTRSALFTAVVAGDLFIVLPALIDACKALLPPSVDRRGGGSLPDAAIPLFYNFPHSGKLLSVSFVLFAGWYADAPIAVAEYPRLAGAGLITLFGSVTAAIPFLLDLFRIPADTFQLFVASGVINSRFGILVAAMHTVAAALLGTCAATGTLRWRPGAVLRYAAVTSILALALIAGTRQLAGTMLRHAATGGDVLAQMEVRDGVEAEIVEAQFDDADGAEPTESSLSGLRLDAIRARGVLRVGYLQDALPFAYVNAHDALVGFDVALMHALARDIGVRLEFVPLDRRTIHDPHAAAALLERGSCDLIVGGMAATLARAAALRLSTPYLEETLGFVVPDRERRRFDSWDRLRASPSLRIVVPDLPYYTALLHRRLPLAHISTVTMLEQFLQSSTLSADAIALPAERGSAWTLRYPQYTVVVPEGSPVKVPLAFAMPRGAPELATLVNTWIDLKRRDGTLDEAYRYWILGQDAGQHRPRWSVVHDVLGWMD